MGGEYSGTGKKVMFEEGPKQVVEQASSSSASVGRGMSWQPNAVDLGIRRFRYDNLNAEMEERVSQYAIGKL